MKCYFSSLFIQQYNIIAINTMVIIIKNDERIIRNTLSFEFEPNGPPPNFGRELPLGTTMLSLEILFET